MAAEVVVVRSPLRLDYCSSSREKFFRRLQTTGYRLRFSCDISPMCPTFACVCCLSLSEAAKQVRAINQWGHPSISAHYNRLVRVGFRYSSPAQAFDFFPLPNLLPTPCFSPHALV